ncbi:MAG: hypothetical protein KBI40_07130 [Firmicutes bacterium]|nr:hypothetical protein [Candidatus Fermentithermobacillaceae bacterium]
MFLFLICAFPLAIVGRKNNTEEYEIKEMPGKQDGAVGEEILSRIVCGCSEVQVVDKKDMPEICAALEERKKKFEK